MRCNNVTDSITNIINSQMTFEYKSHNIYINNSSMMDMKIEMESYKQMIS
jgi:ferritin